MFPSSVAQRATAVHHRLVRLTDLTDRPAPVRLEAVGQPAPDNRDGNTPNRGNKAQTRRPRKSNASARGRETRIRERPTQKASESDGCPALPVGIRLCFCRWTEGRTDGRQMGGRRRTHDAQSAAQPDRTRNTVAPPWRAPRSVPQRRSSPPAPFPSCRVFVTRRFASVEAQLRTTVGRRENQ